MKNKEVITAFLNRQKAKTLNLHTKQDNEKFVLINYETPIAYIQDNDLWIDKCKYSATTSKIQNELISQATRSNYTILYYNQNKVNKKGGR